MTTYGLQDQEQDIICIMRLKDPETKTKTTYETTEPRATLYTYNTDNRRLRPKPYMRPQVQDQDYI